MEAVGGQLVEDGFDLLSDVEVELNWGRTNLPPKTVPIEGFRGLGR